MLREVYRTGDDTENPADEISPSQDGIYSRAFREGPHWIPLFLDLSSDYFNVCFITL